MRKHPKKENLLINLTNNFSIFLKTTLARNFSKDWKNPPGWLRNNIAEYKLRLLVKANEDKPIIIVTPQKSTPVEPLLTPLNSPESEPKNDLFRSLDFKDEGNEGGGE